MEQDTIKLLQNHKIMDELLFHIYEPAPTIDLNQDCHTFLFYHLVDNSNDNLWAGILLQPCNGDIAMPTSQ